MHSHLTQWIEEADARQFCLASDWSRVPAMRESHCLHLDGSILKVPARVGNYALACARRVTRFMEDQDGLMRRQDHATEEPTLSDLLQDPITLALMAADHVDRSQLDAVLAAASGSLSHR